MKTLYLHSDLHDSVFRTLTMLDCAAGTFRIPCDPADPEALLQDICSIAETEQLDFLTGRELGGFFAALASVRLNLPALLIDPVLNPADEMPRIGFVCGHAPYRALAEELVYCSPHLLGCIVHKRNAEKMRLLPDVQYRVLPDRIPEHETVMLHRFCRELLLGKSAIVPQNTHFHLWDFRDAAEEFKKMETAEEYREAAEQGNRNAQFNLGLAYFFGDGVKQDYALAMHWFMKAAEQGHSTAQYNLAIMYRHGYGVTADNAAAVEWYRKAAEQGHLNAQLNLGYMYSEGLGIAADFGEAKKWYMKAAEQGSAGAENNIGAMYLNGEGMEKDALTAMKWFLKAAEKGDANAQNNLGVLYLNGLGTEKDAAAAMRWFQKAAEQEHAPAQFHLGVMLYEGGGISKNYAQGIEWLRKAAAQGERNAVSYLKKLGMS